MLRSVTLLLILAAACSSSHATPSDAPVDSSRDDATPAPTGGWVLGYYVGYQNDLYPLEAIDWHALTHIAFAPMVVNTDLSLDLSFDDANPGHGPRDAMALATAAHTHHVTPLLLLGGANAGANIATAAGAAHRADFVRALLAALDQLGYDGLDLDWEDSVNLDDLVSLAHDLRAARPAIVLTYPAYPINPNFETVDPRMATLAASLDQFNVQTYSPATGETGDGWSSWFTSPLSGSTTATPIAIDDTLARYAAVGIPKAKLGMGIAFYAICYIGDSHITGPRQATTTSDFIQGGDNNYPLSAFFAKDGTLATHASAVHRDDIAHEPYLALASPIVDARCSSSATSYLSYEDETSIADKGAFARANGYGGIIVWTLAEGYLPADATGGRSPDALFEALHAAFVR